MEKIVVISNSGEFLPVVLRLRNEGYDVGIYIHSPQYKACYSGILPSFSIVGVSKAVREADLVIFDSIRLNEGHKQDAGLLKMFGAPRNGIGCFGAIAQHIIGDVPVIGACPSTEEITSDSESCLSLMQQLGFAVPETYDFDNFNESTEFFRNGTDGLWRLVPKDSHDLGLAYQESFPGELAVKIVAEYIPRRGATCRHSLQRVIAGIEVSSEVWVGQGGPAHYNHNLPCERLCNDDLGQRVGNQANTVWMAPEPVTAPVKALAEYLDKVHYQGPVSVKTIIPDNQGAEPQFVSCSPRFSYDSLYCLLSMLKGSIGRFLLNGFAGNFLPGYAVSQRITVPPFPYMDLQLLDWAARGVALGGDLEKMPWFWGNDLEKCQGRLCCAGSDGILGVVVGTGSSLGEAWGRVYRQIKKLKVYGYAQYRTDGHKVAKKRLGVLKKKGLLHG